MALLLTGGIAAQGQGHFCGPVGTEDCDAIAADSSIIIGWATGCTIERGPIRIGSSNTTLASFGVDSTGTGPATMNVATDAVSLGDGGVATLTFAEPIRNVVGPDFAVFENGIVSDVTGNAFLELAFVEVSTDGVRYVRFPATSLTPTNTQVGSFGEVDPTMINNLAGKYQIGYGTPFDLEELRDSTGIDIDSIIYVRLVDVIGTINPEYATYDAYGHIVNDPYPTPFNSSGFDLTGVAVLRGDTTQHNSIESVQSVLESVYPNPAIDRITVCTTTMTDAELLDFCGRVVMRLHLHEGVNDIDLSALRQGIYILRADGTARKIIKRK